MKKEELKHLIFESIGEEIKKKDEYHVDYDVGFSDEEIMENPHIMKALKKAEAIFYDTFNVSLQSPDTVIKIVPLIKKTLHELASQINKIKKED